MKAWLANNDPRKPLDLSYLGLTSLPDLPPSLQKLNVAHNQLTSLPDLPPSLRDLNVYRNQLTSLPALPPSLQKLNASWNELTSLPDLPPSLQTIDVIGNWLTSLPNLPPSLQTIDVIGNRLTSLPALPPSLQNFGVGSNRLTSLPDLPPSLQNLLVHSNWLTSLPDLPSSLRRVDVRNNRLSSLPEDITATLGSNCHVNLENNPFPARVRQNLQRITSTPGYQGPRIYFSMATAADTGPARPLAEAVSDWCGEGMEELKAAWSSFQHEEGADNFSRFLDRLRDTVNYSNPQFRQSVVAWLTQLTCHPELRKNTFVVSTGATASCEDRVSLTYNDMKKVRVAFDVETGLYDKRLDELMQLARGMFRLDQLEKIARKKVESLNFVDEIEVYLAYQVKLREPLQLPLDTPDMRYFRVAYVTDTDLAAAEQSVKASENQDFVHYLTTQWQPWQAVLSRLHGEHYEKAQEQLIEAAEDEFQKRLEARLEESGLQNDADARRTAGPQVMAEIEREIKVPLTRKFLETQQLSHLLDPQW